MNLRRAVNTGIDGLVDLLPVFLGIIALAVLFRWGAKAVSYWMIEWSPLGFWITVGMCVFVLGPLALVPPARGFAAMGLLIASFVFAAILLAWGFAVTYLTWGMLAVSIGLFVMGFGVVPIAMLAAALHGDWWVILSFVIMIALALGTRMLALSLADAAERRAARLALQS